MDLTGQGRAASIDAIGVALLADLLVNSRCERAICTFDSLVPIVLASALCANLKTLRTEPLLSLSTAQWHAAVLHMRWHHKAPDVTVCH